MGDDVSRLADGLDSHSDAAIDEHVRQLDVCLEEGMDSSAVVVLNAGFESLISQILLEELDRRDDVLAEHRIDDIERNDASYSRLLEEAAGLDIIDDQNYDLLDGIRDERNRYVHSDSRAVSRADVDRHGDLQEGSHLYHEVLEEAGYDDLTDRTTVPCEKQWQRPAVAPAAC